MKDEEQQQNLLGKIEQGSEDHIPNLEGDKPKLVQQEPSAANLQLASYAVMAANMICGVMAAKRGGHWLLTDEDNKNLHAAFARVAQQYVVIDMDSPLMGLAACAGAILLPRLALEMMNSKKNEPVAVQEGGEGGNKPEH